MPVVHWVEGLQPRHWLIETELHGYENLHGFDDLHSYGDADVVAEAEEAAPAEVAVTDDQPAPAEVALTTAIPSITQDETPTPADDAAVPRSIGEVEEQSAPWLLIGLAVSVVAIVVAGAVIVRATTGHSGHAATASASAISHSSVPTAASTARTASAVAWLVDALGRHSTLVADVSIRAALLAQGLGAGTVFAAGQPVPATTNFVVSTRQLRDIAAAGQDGAVARLLAESQPVAQFGTGADSIQVRQVIPNGDKPSLGAANRTMAGKALLSNKALSVVPEAETLLSEGRLDLRAATLIAALAAQTPVRLIGLAQQQVEASAGAPIRTVQLDLGGSATLLSEYIEALPPSYRPASNQRQSDGSYVIQWRPDLATAPPVS